MKKLFLIYRYLKYIVESKSRFKIHSKFVFDFVNEILRDNRQYDDYTKLWDIRSRMANSNDPVETVDFGSKAGKNAYSTRIIPLKRIVRMRSHSQPRLKLLYRLTKFYKPNNILEFGTAAGISGAYIKSGNPDSKFVSMEGCANLASKAQEVFDELEFSDVEIAVGNFDTNLNKVLKKFTTLDFVFFDGNHREKPTLAYYESCAKLLNENSIFVFDDIHWSKGMESAWNTIKKDSRVSVTIDLFWFGIVFFRKGIEKQDFIIRY